MTRKLAFLALAAQLLATSALAQTDNSTGAQPEGSGMSTTYGSDWSTSLGAALLAEDGTTVRSSAEIGTQWSTLSQTDKDMIRRDCMVHMQMQGNASGSTDSTTGGAATTDSATTGDAAQSGTGSGATGGSQTGTSGDATATTDSSGTGSSTTTTGAAALNVTMAQLDQICAATKDLQ